MAVKRNAQDAFGKENVHLSAFAAAKLRRGIAGLTTQENPTEESKEEKIIQDALPEQLLLTAPSEAISQSLLNATAEPLLYTSETVKVTTDEPHTTITTCTLKLNETVLAIGEYDLEVLEGAVTVHGALLRRNSGVHRVFAPSTHALPRIVCRKSPTRIRLTSVESTLRHLESLSPLFRNIWAQSSHKQSYTVLRDGSTDELRRNFSAVEEAADTQRLISQLCLKVDETGTGKQVSVATIGTKSSGKSTLNRSICNAFLTRSPVRHVLYLDIDPGQPEFGPPGQISLVEVCQPVYGPPYTHLASSRSETYKLLHAHTIAATTFKENPEHYYSCVKHLYKQARVAQRAHEGRCPIVVNTAGWVNGLGARVLQDVLELGVTDAVLIDIADQSLMQAVQAKTDHSYAIGRAAIRPASRTSAELRQMQAMAYFHTEAGATVLGERIDRWRPWILPYTGSQSVVSTIVSYGPAFNTKFLNEVLDGTLVAILTSSDDSPVEQQLLEKITYKSDGLAHLQAAGGLDPLKFDLHGLGLIRGIDIASESIQLVTPLSDQTFAKLVTKGLFLVRGAFDNPHWAYFEAFQSQSGDHLASNAPWTNAQEMVGIEGAVWRLRHPPTIAQLGGKR